jgi:hypothetical protein
MGNEGSNLDTYINSAARAEMPGAVQGFADMDRHVLSRDDGTPESQPTHHKEEHLHPVQK